jgi:hypothetical protein
MKHTEVIISCTKDPTTGQWYGEVDTDALYDVLAGFPVDAKIEDEGIGPYEAWGQCGVHHSWEATEVEGSADVEFELDFGDYEFETDEEQEAAHEQVWASLEVPSVPASDSEDDVSFSFTWEPVTGAGPTITFQAEI